MMKKQFLLLLVATLLAAPSMAALVTETAWTYDGWIASEVKIADNLDTLQTTPAGQIDTVAPSGSVWGDITVSCRDAGQEWWNFGTNSAVAPDGAGGALQFIFNGTYTGGRTLDQLNISLGSISGNGRTLYEFYVGAMDLGGVWHDLGSIIGGSTVVGSMQLITIEDINIDNVSWIQVWSNPRQQPSWPGWNFQPDINQVDVYMVPEPATMGLVAIGGLFLRRKRK